MQAAPQRERSALWEGALSRTMWDKCQGNRLDADVPAAEPLFSSTSVFSRDWNFSRMKIQVMRKEILVVP